MCGPVNADGTKKTSVSCHDVLVCKEVFEQIVF